MSIVIGVDLGTSNIKVIACSLEGTIVFRTSAPCELLQPSPEQAEHHPETILSLVTQLLKEAFDSVDHGQIKAVSFSAAMHSIIAIDAAGNCLTNALLWGDTRATEQEARLKKDGTATLLYQQTGVPLHPTLPVCKILWLKENEPEIFGKADKFISLKEFIIHRYFGVYKVDHSIAAASGLQQLHNLEWSPLALKASGIDARQLSEIVAVTHIENELQEEYKTLWGISHKIPFVMGSSDGCLANIGTGVVDETAAALTIGTSGAVRISSRKKYINDHASLFCYPVTKQLFVTGGAVNNGGYVLEWFAENMLNINLAKDGAYKALVQLAHSVAVGAEELIFLPYLRGDRAPIWDAKARGVFFGLNSLHKQAHMVRAVMEGIIYALYDVFCEMDELDDLVEALYVSGGFIKSPQWVQMVADIFNRKVVAADVADASAMGAVYVGFYAAGITPSITSLAALKHQGTEYLPNAENHLMYQKNFLIFRSLYQALKNEFPKLGN